MIDTIKNVKRISPLLFSPLTVPDEIVNKLNTMGCKVPQAATIHEPHNIINGEFAISGQTDWAAVCSKETGTSFIIVLWGGKSPCSSIIDSSKDPDNVWIRFPVMNETYKPNYFKRDRELEGYLRNIRKVSSEYFTDGENSSTEKNRKKFTNEGVVEFFSIDEVDTNSYYCIGGKWLKIRENEGD